MRVDVAKLTEQVKAGKVTSQEFFQALLAGFPAIQAQASSSTTTIASALQTLDNQLGRYVGQTDSSLGATQRMAQGIGRSMSIDNISDRFSDLNPHDQVYRSDNGYTVKVKVVSVPTGDPRRLNFLIGGSWCDDETAKAVAHPGGLYDRFILTSELAPHSDSAMEGGLARVVEEAREDMVRRVELAAGNEYERRALTGVLALEETR